MTALSLTHTNTHQLAFEWLRVVLYAIVARAAVHDGALISSWTQAGLGFLICWAITQTRVTRHHAVDFAQPNQVATRALSLSSSLSGEWVGGWEATCWMRVCARVCACVRRCVWQLVRTLWFHFSHCCFCSITPAPAAHHQLVSDLQLVSGYLMGRGY